MLPKLREMEENWLTPMVLSKIFSRSIYGIATWNSLEKIKSKIPCEQNHPAWFLKNGETVFSKLIWHKFLSVPGEQVSRQANTWPLVLPFSFRANVEMICNEYFWFLLTFDPTVFVYHGKTFRKQVCFCSK